MLVTSWLSDNDDDWDWHDRDILQFQDQQQDFDNHDLDWNGDQHDQHDNDQLIWSRSYMRVKMIVNIARFTKIKVISLIMITIPAPLKHIIARTMLS